MIMTIIMMARTTPACQRSSEIKEIKTTIPINIEDYHYYDDDYDNDYEDDYEYHYDY